MKFICTQGYKDVFKKGGSYELSGKKIKGDDGDSYFLRWEHSGHRVYLAEGEAGFKPLIAKNEVDGCPGVTYSYDEEDCCLSFHFDGKELTCWSVDDSDFIDGMIEDFRKIYKLGESAGSGVRK